MPRLCQDAGMSGMGSDIKGETKLGEQTMRAHVCVHVCTHLCACVYTSEFACMCTSVCMHGCACFVCARGAPTMWMASASTSQSPPTHWAIYKGLEAVQVGVRPRPCPPGAGHSGALGSGQRERRTMAETPGGTEIHPEVQMYQMLFWKMSLASIPEGGSRGSGAGARYMQAGHGKSEDPGLGRGGQ